MLRINNVTDVIDFVNDDMPSAIARVSTSNVLVRNIAIGHDAVYVKRGILANS